MILLFIAQSVTIYATNAKIRGLVWMGFSLPFVPIDRLQEAVQLMRDDCVPLEDDDNGVSEWSNVNVSSDPPGLRVYGVCTSIGTYQ